MFTTALSGPLPAPPTLGQLTGVPPLANDNSIKLETAQSKTSSLPPDSFLCEFS